MLLVVAAAALVRGGGHGGVGEMLFCIAVTEVGICFESEGAEGEKRIYEWCRQVLNGDSMSTGLGCKAEGPGWRWACGDGALVFTVVP